MSEISRDVNPSAGTSMGPDLFQYYIRGIAELLSGDAFTPSSSKTSSRAKEAGAGDEKVGSLFFNPAGDGLSGFRKERLVSMLRQSVVALTQEADEMLDPVLSMQWLRGLMAPTKGSASYQDANCKDENENRAQKRLKVLSSSSTVKEPLIVRNLNGEGSPNERKGVANLGKSLTRCCNKKCAKFSKLIIDTQKSNPDASKFLCDDCSKKAKESPSSKVINGSVLGTSSRNDKENGEVNDDLQVLLVNRGPKVEEKLKKHSAELSETLRHIQEKLEKLLDVVISNCRPMTLAERIELRKLIEKLHPKHLERVVEIIQQRKPSEKGSSHQITINLQHEEDLTLWRLYFYVKAVENADKLLV